MVFIKRIYQMTENSHTAASRKIIHIDCDCFFAAIEMRDNPELADKAIAVGGNAKTRGVIATCNYAAREFGVHSAMPTAQALKICPELIIVPPRFQEYKNVSKQMHNIFKLYTSIIEPLSLDEAFLDVSDCTQHQGSATLIAKDIRKLISQSLNITASAGIAPNKFIAKIASDWNKPNGQKVITPDQTDAFTKALPINKIFGVGKVTEKKMRKLGIHTCNDLRSYSLFDLDRMFGSFGGRLHQLCRGIDNRPVKTSRQRKSLSVEKTYAQDLTSLEQCIEHIPALLTECLDRIKKLNMPSPIKSIFVVLRFNDFSRTTTERSGLLLTTRNIKNLLEINYRNHQKPVRLIGVGVRFSNQEHNQESVHNQQSLFP